MLFTENLQVQSKKEVMATGILILITVHEAVVSIMIPFVYYTFFFS